MNVKNLSVIFCGALLIQQNAFAQYWHGYGSMLHAGVNSLHIQPASSVSSIYRYDIQIGGIESYSVTTDAFPLSMQLLKEDPALFLAKNHNQVEGEAIAFPSFIWKIDDKNAVGLDMKLRSVFAIDPRESSLAELLTNYIYLGQSDFSSGDEVLTSRSAAWFEVGFNYARNLIDKPHHRLNLGITPKIIFGEGTANLRVENVNIEQNVSTGMVDISGHVDFQYSKSIDDWKEDRFSYVSRISPAFSAGIEYLYYSDLSGSYKLKIGVSVIDIGKMKYTRSIYAGTFEANNLLVDSEIFNNVDVLNVWAELVRTLFDRIPNENEHLEIALPTRFSLQADYHIKSGYYINVATFFALKGAENQLEQAPDFHTFVVTPRFERENWGVSLPLKYDGYSGYATGVSAFYGPVFLGVSNFFRVIFDEDNSKRLGVYIGLKFGKR